MLWLKEFFSEVLFKFWLLWKIPKTLWYYNIDVVDECEVILVAHARKVEYLKWQAAGSSSSNRPPAPYCRVRTPFVLIFSDEGPYLHTGGLRGEGFAVGTITDFWTFYDNFPCQLMTMTIPAPTELYHHGRSYGKSKNAKQLGLIFKAASTLS